MSLEKVELWFKRALVKPEEKFSVQNSCHIEEFVEYLDQLEVTTEEASLALIHAVKALTDLKDRLRNGSSIATIKDRKEFLDALADQIVTAVGSGFTAGMNVPYALVRVNASNYSKFDAKGMPIFDANGKIAKNMATYYKPDLTGLY